MKRLKVLLVALLFAGPAATADVAQDMATDMDMRQVLVNYADGSWEKWYISWEEVGNLYKIEQYDASYVKAGTGFFLTYEAIETADSEKRDSLVPNVGWGFGKKYSGLRISRISPGPCDASTRVNRPLSGPTKKQPSDWTTIPRRAPPTPGSTTARWTVPSGK